MIQAWLHIWIQFFKWSLVRSDFFFFQIPMFHRESSSIYIYIYIYIYKPSDFFFLNPYVS